MIKLVEYKVRHVINKQMESKMDEIERAALQQQQQQPQLHLALFGGSAKQVTCCWNC